MTTVSFVAGERGLDPLVPRPIDRPLTIDLDHPDVAAMDNAKIFAAPSNPADWPRWRQVLTEWRRGIDHRNSLARERYDQPEGAWASRCYAVAQVWLWDELLYDFSTGTFTPDRLLADARRRFGGFDGVVLWHAYPVIGIDERNQWDFYRDVPGLSELVATLRDAGVAVFVDYNPWDTGTSRGDDDVVELSSLVRELGVDGVFLDTLKEGAPVLVRALEAVRPGIGLEGESTLALARIAEHRLSWAQWFADSDVPGVLRSHYAERRHMQHHVRRWHRSHAEELQSAFVNGVGVMVWEVVFGAWVGWSARDAATLRRMLTIQRAASDLLRGGDWTPLAALHPQATASNVYGSAFSQHGVTLYCLVNRGPVSYLGPVLPEEERGRVVGLPSLTISADGIGAAVTLDAAAAQPPWLAPLQEQLSLLPNVGDAAFPYRETTRVPGEPSTTGEAAADSVRVPAGRHRLTVRYRMRETGIYGEAPFVDEWKPLPPRLHDQRTIERVLVLDHEVAVARHEVSNAEFDRFVRHARYVPRTPYRFRGSGSGSGAGAGARDAAAPATFVDLDDARAYARWVGARLPSEDEWQLAAQSDSAGWARSPRVWNWTESEHSDGRTRFVLLKGGSDYLAVGSQWYFDGGAQSAEFSAKLLLPGLGQARSSRIGFRLAWDRAATGAQ